VVAELDNDQMKKEKRRNNQPEVVVMADTRSGCHAM